MQPVHMAFLRIQKNIQIDETGCWIWQGALAKDAYGQIKVDGKTLSTHRVAYMAVFGEIPRGKVIRHSCDQSMCCNPGHLVVGDHEDNIQDILDRKRAPRRVLTAVEIQSIGDMRSQGFTKRRIAEAMHASWYVISRVIDANSIDVKRVGRPKGSRNQMVRVTDEIKKQIKAEYAAGGVTQKQLAEKFGCDQTYVSLICKRD